MLHDGVRDRGRSHGLRRGGKASILPVPFGHPHFMRTTAQYVFGPSSSFLRLCAPPPTCLASRTLAMSASADHPLAGVLCLRDAGASQLGTGIADKICAAFRPGISSVPTTGTAEVNGVKWRLLVDKALLTPDETAHFLIWLEEEHGPDIVQRAQQAPRHLDIPSSVSLAGNYSGVKQEEVLAPLRQQYGATSGLGGPSALFSSGSPGRTRAEPYSGGADVTATNLTLASDMAAMGGMNGQSIATLTFVMLTCRLPPQDKDLGYGTDPTMSKAYSKVKQGGHGTLLIDLLGQSSTLALARPTSTPISCWPPRPSAAVASLLPHSDSPRCGPSCSAPSRPSRCSAST